MLRPDVATGPVFGDGRWPPWRAALAPAARQGRDARGVPSRLDASAGEGRVQRDLRHGAEGTRDRAAILGRRRVLRELVLVDAWHRSHGDEVDPGDRGRTVD